MKNSYDETNNSFSLKLLQEIADIDSKNEILLKSIYLIENEINNNFNLLLNEKNEFKNFNNEIEKILFNIKNLKDQINIFEINNNNKILIENLKIEFNKKNNYYLKLNKKFNLINKNYNFELNKINQKINNFEQILLNYNKPSLFLIWKNLINKYNDQEQIINNLNEKINEFNSLKLIFNQTLYVLSEKQEIVEKFKNLILKEKLNFKKKLLEIYS